MLSALFQVRAAANRWVVFPQALNENAVVIENHEFDYFLSVKDYLPVPGTGINFGIGMFLQAAGLLCILVALLQLRRRHESGQRIPGAYRVIVLSLGVLSMAGFALIGLNSMLTEIHGATSLALFDSIAGLVGLFLSALALVALAVIAWFKRPSLGAACALLLGATLPGYLIISMVIAPKLLGYSSHDTTPGTEFFIALVTFLAALPLFGLAPRLLHIRDQQDQA